MTDKHIISSILVELELLGFVLNNFGDVNRVRVVGDVIHIAVESFQTVLEFFGGFVFKSDEFKWESLRVGWDLVIAEHFFTGFRDRGGYVGKDIEFPSAVFSCQHINGASGCDICADDVDSAFAFINCIIAVVGDEVKVASEEVDLVITASWVFGVVKPNEVRSDAADLSALYGLSHAE